MTHFYDIINKIISYFGAFMSDRGRLLNSVQVLYERILGFGTLFLAVFHILLSLSRYTFDYYRIARPFECRYALILLVLAALYLPLCIIFRPDGLSRIRDFLKKLYSPGQLFCIALFLWYILSCLVNTNTSGIAYFRYNDWWLLDTGINCLILFSLPKVLPVEKSRRLISFILHVVLISGTAFAVYGLLNLFALNIVTLPSGEQIGMSETNNFCLASNSNITGAIALSFVLICIYLAVTQKGPLKIFYITAFSLHLFILYMSSCRAAFAACLVSCTLAVFLILLHCLPEEHKIIRAVLCVILPLIAAGGLWMLRPVPFRLFDKVTHFSEVLNAGQEIPDMDHPAFFSDDGKNLINTAADFTDTAPASQQPAFHESYLGGRRPVWNSALRVIVSSPLCFLFGTTPVGAAPAMLTIGKLSYEAAHAHNEILQMGLSMGVPMMAAFAVFLSAMVFKSLRQGLSFSANGHFSGAYILPVVIIGLLTLTLVEAYLAAYFSLMSCLFFLFCGWVDALTEKRKETGSGDFFLKMMYLFIAAFILRFFLNAALKNNITISIDEGLFTNLARSLARDGQAAYRSQPVNDPYLLYPLVLVPLYRIHRFIGGDIYRWIQIFNTMLITSSLFPAALFSYKFSGSRRKAAAAALITVLMPDMLMGGFAMAESLIWPLSLWLVYFCFRFFECGKLRFGCLAAVISGALFFIKPGAVIMGAVMLFLYLISALRQSRHDLLSALLPLILLLLCLAAGFCLVRRFLPEGFSLPGLYEKQISGWTARTIFVVPAAFLWSVYLFIFACGGICGLIPWAALEGCSGKKRLFITSFIAGVLVSLLGTAVFVVPYQWDAYSGSFPLHMRYTAMYVPVMYVISQDRDSLTDRDIRRLSAALIAFAVLAVFPGVRAGFVSGFTTEIDSMSLSAFFTGAFADGSRTGWILTAFTVLFTLFLICRLHKDGFSSGLQCASFLFFAAFLIFNAVCAHFAVLSSLPDLISTDALEVNELTVEKEHLGIMQRYYDDFNTFWLESRLNAPMQQVTIDQMFLALAETDGVYVPFVPLEQAPNVKNHSTPKTDSFVLGRTIPGHLEINEQAEVYRTASDYFMVMRIGDGERLFDTMMYGFDNNDLYPGKQGFLQIFDDGRNINGTLRLTVTAAGHGDLLIGETRISLTPSAEIYEITLPFRKRYELRALDGIVRVYSYSTAHR